MRSRLGEALIYSLRWRLWKAGKKKLSANLAESYGRQSDKVSMAQYSQRQSCGGWIANFEIESCNL